MFYHQNFILRVIEVKFIDTRLDSSYSISQISESQNISFKLTTQPDVLAVSIPQGQIICSTVLHDSFFFSSINQQSNSPQGVDKMKTHVHSSTLILTSQNKIQFGKVSVLMTYLIQILLSTELEALGWFKFQEKAVSQINIQYIHTFA